MSPLLPKRIDIRRLADTAQCLKGNIPLADMPRISALTSNSEASQVAVELNFSIRQDGWAVVQGSVATEVIMQCQRCLEEMSVPLQSSVNLGLVTSETEERRLPEDLEPVMATEEPLSLAELVEDELLLVVPLAPLHETCDAPVAVEIGSVEEPEVEKRENPFAVLESIKSDLPKAD